MMIEVLLTALALSIAAPEAEPAMPQTNENAEMMRQLGSGGLSGKALAEAIDKAAVHPLGSLGNPVRTDRPVGERAYLGKLRCADGSAPSYLRAGNVGVGVYGYIIDHYQVTCPSQPAVSVYMDMDHVHEESRPVPGFIMAGEAPLPTS